MDPITKWTCSPTVVKKQPNLIKKLHIYDFDNTLFKSAWPNKMLYVYPTLQTLLNNTYLLTGGWWDDPVPFELILKLSGADTTENNPTFTSPATNPTVTTGRKSNLSSYWNHDILKLSKLSNVQEDTITILLTGRKENIFKNIILKIIELSRLEDPIFLQPSLQFDAICLKRTTTTTGSSWITTMMYKTPLVRDFLDYYPNLEEVTIYDDMMNQINGFNNFFNEIKHKFPNLQWFVVPVEPKFTTFPQYVEFLYFQTVLQRHNKLLTSLPFKGQYCYYKLKWTNPKYGYFLQLESYQLLINRIEKTLTDMLYGKINDRVDYHIDIVNLFDYPCYIPCQLPNGKYLSTEILYRIITRNKNPNVPNKVMNSVVSNYLQVPTDQTFMNSDDDNNYFKNNPHYNSKNKNHYYHNNNANIPPELCKYDFLLKTFGIKLRDIDNDNRVIKLEIFVKFQPTKENMECCYSLYNQFILVSYNNETKKQQHTVKDKSPDVKQINGMVLDKIYWNSCIEDPLVIKTTFGTFSKMKCIRS